MWRVTVSVPSVSPGKAGASIGNAFASGATTVRPSDCARLALRRALWPGTWVPTPCTMMTLRIGRSGPASASGGYPSWRSSSGRMPLKAGPLTSHCRVSTAGSAAGAITPRASPSPKLAQPVSSHAPASTATARLVVISGPGCPDQLSCWSRYCQISLVDSWCSGGRGSGQERRVRRALVNSVEGSVGSFTAAEAQPGGLAPLFPAAMTCYLGLKERTMAVVERVSGESRLTKAGLTAASPCFLPSPLTGIRRTLHSTPGREAP